MNNSTPFQRVLKQLSRVRSVVRVRALCAGFLAAVLLLGPAAAAAQEIFFPRATRLGGLRDTKSSITIPRGTRFSLPHIGTMRFAGRGDWPLSISSNGTLTIRNSGGNVIGTFGPQDLKRLNAQITPSLAQALSEGKHLCEKLSNKRAREAAENAEQQGKIDKVQLQEILDSTPEDNKNNSSLNPSNRMHRQVLGVAQQDAAKRANETQPSGGKVQQNNIRFTNDQIKNDGQFGLGDNGSEERDCADASRPQPPTSQDDPRRQPPPDPQAAPPPAPQQPQQQPQFPPMQPPQGQGGGQQPQQGNQGQGQPPPQPPPQSPTDTLVCAEFLQRDGRIVQVTTGGARDAVATPGFVRVIQAGACPVDIGAETPTRGGELPIFGNLAELLEHLLQSGVPGTFLTAVIETIVTLFLGIIGGGGEFPQTAVGHTDGG